MREAGREDGCRAKPEPLPLAPASVSADVAAPHTLSTTARAEFEQGLTTEVQKSIDDKAKPSSVAVGLLVLILLAAVNMILACIVRLIAAAITNKAVTGSYALEPALRNMRGTGLLRPCVARLHGRKNAGGHHRHDIAQHRASVDGHRCFHPRGVVRSFAVIA